MGEFALVLSRELDSVPARHQGTPEPAQGEALALRPIREFAHGKSASVVDSQFAVLVAFVAFLVLAVFALLGLSMLARVTREHREVRAKRFRSRWEPVLYGRMAGDSVPLPQLARTEHVLFLTLWLHTLGYVRDEAIDGMLSVAYELDMPKYVLRLLESRVPFERLLAIRMAGALRLKEAIVPLQRKAAQRRPHSALEATSALLRVSPEHGFVALRELLAHLEWSPGAIAGMAKAGGEGATLILAGVLASLPPGGGKQIIRLIEMLDDYAAVPGLRERLRDNRDDEEIAAILHALGRLGGAPERASVLTFLDHRSWLVRMQAVAALGALGLPGDGDRLVTLLSDAQWWVRYRTAQAILKLRGAEALRHIRGKIVDPYASDILDRVLAEC